MKVFCVRFEYVNLNIGIEKFNLERNFGCKQWRVLSQWEILNSFSTEKFVSEKF